MALITGLAFIIRGPGRAPQNQFFHWFCLQRWPIDFCRALRDRTWHVPRVADRSATGTIVFRCSGASNEYSPVPIGPAVRAPEAKMFGHTDTQTSIGRPTFSHRPIRENLRAEAFNSNAMKPFYSTILNSSCGRNHVRNTA